MQILKTYCLLLMNYKKKCKVSLADKCRPYIYFRHMEPTAW